MKKGQTKRIWTVEQKLEIIREHLEEHKSVRTLEKEYNANQSMICRWIKSYKEKGIDGISPQKHTGNPFAALHTSKNLSEIDRLKLRIAKLEIENERLKKGYQVKGAGASKEFVTLKDVSTK